MMDIQKQEPKPRLSFYGNDARRLIVKGVDAVANAVKVTMGAKGRNVITSYGHVTKDGVTVARDVELYDAPESHGAKLIKAASVKTCDVVGDGTTQVCVLAQKMIHEGMRLIEQGKDPQDLKREMDACKDSVIASFKAQAQPVTDIRSIANISANSEEIGALVAEAVQAAGVDGLVTIENTYEGTRVEIVEGMQVDRGMVYPVFATELERRRATYETTKVLIYKGKLHDAIGLAKVLEEVVKTGSPILIIADDYDLPVLTLLANNKNRGLKLLPIKAPMVFHDETLDDIAVYSGARIVTEADGFKNFPMSSLGTVKSVVSTMERTVILSFEDRKEAITKRVEEIYELAKSFRDAEKRNVEKRASRLKGKMAIVKLASTTEEEGREIRDRIEDAIYASQAALEMGVIPGGGVTYRNATNLQEDTDGARVIVLALMEPMRQIIRNAGKNDADILKMAKETGKGYNVKTDQFEDFLSTGVVDPLKVAITAFENALSVATLALTTEVLICDDRE